MAQFIRFRQCISTPVQQVRNKLEPVQRSAGICQAKIEKTSNHSIRISSLKMSMEKKAISTDLYVSKDFSSLRQRLRGDP